MFIGREGAGAQTSGGVGIGEGVLAEGREDLFGDAGGAGISVAWTGLP